MCYDRSAKSLERSIDQHKNTVHSADAPAPVSPGELMDSARPRLGGARLRTEVQQCVDSTAKIEKIRRIMKLLEQLDNDGLRWAEDYLSRFTANDRPESDNIESE